MNDNHPEFSSLENLERYMSGGPPPEDDDDAIISRIKKIIEPQIDGLFTIYDGDSVLMKEFQESVPKKDRIEPIEFSVGKTFVHYGESSQDIDPLEIKTPVKNVRPIVNRTDILKKKRDSALCVEDQTDGPTPSKKPKKVTDSFQHLAEQKLELVQLQKITCELDMEHKRQMYAIELEDATEQNNHKKLIREMELIIMNLKIKQMSE